MKNQHAASLVRLGFEEIGVEIPIEDIHPLRIVSDRSKESAKYKKIEASIREIGLVEPPVVARDRSDPNKYLLLDGHLRIEVLKQMAETKVACLISTDQEAFTYNRHVNRVATIQEHRMVLKALKRGVSQERLAKALNVNVTSIRSRRNLLKGICPEATDILKDKFVPINTFTELRRMQPMRQIEAAELMVTMNKFSTNYAKSLVAATPEAQLVTRKKPFAVRKLTKNQIQAMEEESANLDRQFKMIEQSYGADHLDLVIARGYLSRLLQNARVEKYLSAHQPEFLAEFVQIVGPHS